MEFRKANEAIGLRVVEGKLTLLIRKVFNVLMYHAQELKVPGLNAPIDTPTSKKYFWVPLSELAADSAYDSKDTEFFKAQLDEMQNIKLRLETDRQWTSERLIASVSFVNTKGLKNRGGQVWFGFAFPPEVHESVMAPGTYTKLSILYQGMLRSGSALALYEICRRYATNPSKVTYVDSYEHWYGTLTGNPVPEGFELPPYKYFKRDVIKPAIAEINALTDIEIELLEHKKGRKVESLQFRVQHTKQPQLDLPGPPVIDFALLERVMKVGISLNEATDLLAANGDVRINSALKFLQTRMESKTSPPLDAPAAYFKWALKQGGAALALQDKSDGTTPTKPAKGSEGPSIMERFLAARAKDALGLYKEMDAPDRDQVFDRFMANGGNPAFRKDRGLEKGVTRTELSFWYAAQLWGQPTVEDISRFVDQLGMG